MNERGITEVYDVVYDREMIALQFLYYQKQTKVGGDKFGLQKKWLFTVHSETVKVLYYRMWMYMPDEKTNKTKPPFFFSAHLS